MALLYIQLWLTIQNIREKLDTIIVHIWIIVTILILILNTYATVNQFQLRIPFATNYLNIELRVCSVMCDKEI